MVFYVHLTGTFEGSNWGDRDRSCTPVTRTLHIFFPIMKPQVECFGQLDECASPLWLIEIFSIFVCKTVAESTFLSTITEHENEPRHMMFWHVCSTNVVDCNNFFLSSFVCNQWRWRCRGEDSKTGNSLTKNNDNNIIIISVEITLGVPSFHSEKACVFVV